MNKDEKYSVAAVVVTFNRLELLKQCIESLRNQTRKLDEIIVVNNSSTDGTFEWLEQQIDLTVITQQNLGSAGGQYTGIKSAYEKGHEWVWCMDDDCFPANDSLIQLVSNIKNDIYVLNSLVVSNIDSRRLSFGLYEEENRVFYSNFDEIKKNVIKSASFFNGTLIHRSVISKVGLPRKELFIRGDEVEYFQRIKKNGFEMYTITSSIIEHPPATLIVIKTFIFNHWFEVIDKHKRYYRSRNFIYNMRKYKNFSLRTFTKILIMDIICIIIYQRQFSVLVANIKGLMAGFSFNLPNVET